jgi:hypothetical protein
MSILILTNKPVDRKHEKDIRDSLYNLQVESEKRFRFLSMPNVIGIRQQYTPFFFNT